MEKYTYLNEWNRTHLKHNSGEIMPDDWLLKYEEYITKINGLFLDLGCGSGNDTKILREQYNKEVISADFSEVAIELLKNKIENVKTVIFDMTKGFPFSADLFSFIISDLSLQYFDYEDTNNIISELRRVIKTEGYILLRLSAVDDYNYGAMAGEKIDYHFYHVEKRNKRYFDEEDIRNFFCDWNICSIIKCEMKSGRYEYPRSVYEVLLRKNETYKGTRTLYNEKILLRHLRQDDAEKIFYGWTNSFEIDKYVIWNRHLSIEETRKVLEKWINSYRQGKKIWGIEFEKTLVGTISVVRETEFECEVGYVVSPNYWNRGIATSSLKLVIDYLATIGYKKVYAEYFEDNAASGRVMEKVGMTKYKTTRMQFNKKTGKEENVICYEIEI